MRKGWAALHAEGRSKIWEAAKFAEVLPDRGSHTGTAASVSTWLARRAPELRQLQLVDCSCDSAAAVHHSGRPQVSCFVVAVAEIKPDYKFRCNICSCDSVALSDVSLRACESGLWTIARCAKALTCIT